MNYNAIIDIKNNNFTIQLGCSFCRLGTTIQNECGQLIDYVILIEKSSVQC